MELIEKDLKNTKSPVGREKLRIHPSRSRLFGRHIIDRFEGQMAWPICMSIRFFSKDPKGEGEIFKKI
jgi:hypothetical protein